MKTKIFALSALITVLAEPPLYSWQANVRGGDFPRRNSIVKLSIDYDASTAPRTGILKSEDGKTILPYQIDRDDRVTFVLPVLEAHQDIRFTSIPDDKPPADTALARIVEDRAQFTVRGKRVADYQTTARKSPRDNLDPKFLRGGYLHPLFTPSGKAVTDDYALNHLHHHGVWTAWTKTRFDGREPDFWNMGQGKGKVDFDSLTEIRSGPVEASLDASHKFTDLTSGTPIDVLHDYWTVTTYDTGAAYHVIDLHGRQSIIGDKPLDLPIYHYGGIGIRGLEGWNGKDAAHFATSESITDRNKANSQPARWIAMAGPAAEGGTAGLAILSHPDNFRAPQPIRTHPTEPFISFAPQTNEAMAIKPGERYSYQYRFIVFDGEADVKLLEYLWQDYAHPAGGNIPRVDEK